MKIEGAAFRDDLYARPMRIRVVDAATLGRWAGLAIWFGLAALLPLRALSPTLAVFTTLGLFIGFLLVGRASPVGVIAVHLGGRLSARLARTPRVDLVVRAPRVDGLVAFLAAGALWLLPLCAGAYAVKNPGLVGIVIAIAVLALTTAGVGALVLGRDRDVVTLGADGLRTAMWGFVPYAAITTTEVDGDDLRVRRDGGPDLLIPLGELAGVVAADLARRRAVHAARPGVVAADRDVHPRVAAVPAEELIGTLRDGTVPREERVRVADILRSAAPEEVRRLAEETADEELASFLGR